MKKTIWLILGCFLLVIGNANAALLTFDDAISGATSYSFDGDDDTIDDVIFTTTDPNGFNTVGPGSNMTYIEEPGLEGTSTISPDLRVDFLVGAAGSLAFGFALDSYTEDDTVTFSVYDALDNLLVSDTVNGLYTSTSSGTSNFPEGYVFVFFSGVATYATFDFTSDYGRYIIDNFEGEFGTSEPTEVEIDIKPGSFPSSINLRKKGAIPVAIHTTDDFDAFDVDPETVLLNDCASPVSSLVYDCDEIANPLYGDPAYPDAPEMIGDGDLDLVLYFDTKELANNNCLIAGDTEAMITGETVDGRPIEGIGDVRIVTKPSK